MKSATGFRGILAILGSFAAMTGTAAAPGTSLPPSPPGCTLPESRQFDFWIGKWAVHPKRNPQLHVADSLIEKRYSGCAIRENWMPLTNEGGGSLSTYVPEKKRWRQFWVDSTGSAVDFAGGWDGRRMVLTGVWPTSSNPKQITRMTFTPLADGSVEQAGDVSDDNGKTWKSSFDFIYARAR
ncbi:MAG: hypothetical protein ACREVV_14030 [Steroidobacteraceae bacterium]